MCGFLPFPPDFLLGDLVSHLYLIVRFQLSVFSSLCLLRCFCYLVSQMTVRNEVDSVHIIYVVCLHNFTAFHLGCLFVIGCLSQNDNRFEGWYQRPFLKSIRVILSAGARIDNRYFCSGCPSVICSSSLSQEDNCPKG